MCNYINITDGKHTKNIEYIQYIQYFNKNYDHIKDVTKNFFKLIYSLFNIFLWYHIQCIVFKIIKYYQLKYLNNIGNTLIVTSLQYDIILFLMD